MKNGIIYYIKNTENQKMYIGQTTNFKKRKKVHKRSLKYGYHHNFYLQNSWDKYGEDKFEFGILKKDISISKLNEKEKYFIKLYNTFGSEGFNLTDGGKNQKKMSEKTIKKMSEASINKYHTLETRNKIRKAKSGKNNYKAKLSKERGKKIYKDHFKNNLSKKELAKREDVSLSTIYEVINLKHWSVRDWEPEL